MKEKNLLLEISIINSLFKTEDAVFICRPNIKSNQDFLVIFRTKTGYWNYVWFSATNKENGLYFAAIGQLEFVIVNKQVKFTFLDYAVISNLTHLYEFISNEANERNEYMSFKNNKNTCGINHFTEINNVLEYKSLLNLLDQMSIRY